MNNLFKLIPKVDEILELDEIKLIQDIPRKIILESIRIELDKIRLEIKNGNLDEVILEKRINGISDVVKKTAIEKRESHLKRVINATGTVVHTNLGRSLLSRRAAEKLVEVAYNYSNLEYNLEKGERGSRYSHVEDLICSITGAESALVVNNNASAVMLILSAIAKEKEVIVSRGELVEIGGSFRIPEVMSQSGATLVEVGATNKTHLKDYENAITENTAALMKVHTSNYRIMGFTQAIELSDMVELAHSRNIPAIEDIGSGVLIDLSKYGLEHEPTVQESIKAGIDILSFSGDKLLGGPQAGIIIGKKEYIQKMKKHPLNRAIRIDKFTVAALEETLKSYIDEETAINEIPTLNMITMPMERLIKKAELLHDNLSCIKEYAEYSIGDSFSQVGGGAMPLSQIPTKTIELSPKYISVNELENRLRMQKTPLIVRIGQEKIIIDVRTLLDEEIIEVARILKDSFEKGDLNE